LYEGCTHNMLSHKPTILQLSVIDIYPPSHQVAVRKVSILVRFP